jgi:dTDP-4-amino-4,6-dideoxygalactose transaminase
MHYPMPVHRQPALVNLMLSTPHHLPVTERAAERVMSLPIFPEMTDAQVDRVADAVVSVAEELSPSRHV